MNFILASLNIPMMLAALTVSPNILFTAENTLSAIQRLPYSYLSRQPLYPPNFCLSQTHLARYGDPLDFVLALICVFIPDSIFFLSSVLKHSLSSYPPSPKTRSIFLSLMFCSVWLIRSPNFSLSDTVSSVTSIARISLVLTSTAICALIHPLCTLHFSLIHSPRFVTFTPEASTAITTLFPFSEIVSRSEEHTSE